MSFFMVAFIVCDHQSFLFVIIVHKVGKVFLKSETDRQTESRTLKNIKENPYTGSITNAIMEN